MSGKYKTKSWRLSKHFEKQTRRLTEALRHLSKDLKRIDPMHLQVVMVIATVVTTLLATLTLYLTFATYLAQAGTGPARGGQVLPTRVDGNSGSTVDSARATSD